MTDLRHAPTPHGRGIGRPRRDHAAQDDAGELAALLALLADLSDTDWRRPTASAGWNVHAMVAHILGQHEESARPLLAARRLHQGPRRFPGRSRLDAHNALQVDELGGLPSAELVSRLATVGPRAVRARRRVPRVVRRLSLARVFPEETLPDNTFGYLLDVLSIRDTWLHRLEIARATGRPFAAAAHDHAVIAQVVRDLAESWSGPPLVLDLTGPAGGQWRLGDGEPTATARIYALDYLWLLSGRGGTPPVAIDGDANPTGALLAARVSF